MFEFSILQIVLMGVVATTFVGSLIYFLSPYLAVARHKHLKSVREDSQEPQLEPVSVVVVVGDDVDYIETGLPILLEQEYPDYEVVLVNDRPQLEETKHLLKTMQEKYPHLYVTTIRRDLVFSHTYKLALTVGVKAARNNRILVLNSDSYPQSKRWLRYMSTGFLKDRQSVVVGYCAIERGKGLVNHYIRASNLYSSMRLLGRAIQGNIYKTAISNFGFTQELFFKYKGFCEHLRMNTGYNDIFIQKIVPSAAVSVIIKRSASVLCPQRGGFSWWFRKRKYDTYMQRYYPFGVKCYLAFDNLFRFLFWISATALVLLSLSMPVVWISVAVLVVLRWVAFFVVMRKVSIRLGESGLLFTFLLYDFISPISETWLSLSRKFRPCKDLWI